MKPASKKCWISLEVVLLETLRTAPVEPLLPIEKKLIGWSLGLSIALLIALVFATRTTLESSNGQGRRRSAGHGAGWASLKQAPPVAVFEII